MLWSDCKSVFHLVRILAHCNGTFGRELLRNPSPLIHSHPQPGRCISAHYCKTDLCVYTAHFCVGLMVVLRTFGNTQTIRDDIYIFCLSAKAAQTSRCGLCEPRKPQFRRGFETWRFESIQHECCVSSATQSPGRDTRKNNRRAITGSAQISERLCVVWMAQKCLVSRDVFSTISARGCGSSGSQCVLCFCILENKMLETYMHVNTIYVSWFLLLVLRCLVCSEQMALRRRDAGITIYLCCVWLCVYGLGGGCAWIRAID